MALTLLAWLAAMLLAPLLNRSNSVAVIGDDPQIRKAIVASHARVAAKKGALLLVQRADPGLAADLINHGTGLVMPDELFLAF